MTEREFKEKAKAIFAPGRQGIFSIFPPKKLIKERPFSVSLILSILFLVLVSYICPDKMLVLIEKQTELIIAIVPSILGLSLAGFAIVISQINTETLERIADIQENKEYSLYQKTNAAFSIMCLTQLFVLIFAVFLSLVMLFSVKIPVPKFLADGVNMFILGLLTFIFLYALFSIFDIIYTIFNSGQVVNFLFLKNKFNKNNVS